MKSKKRENRRSGGPPAVAVAVAAAEAPAPNPNWHYFALGVLAAAIVVLWAYWPSMNGPFLFDDTYLPFAVSNISTQPLSTFLHGQRPLLMATYWLSARLSPDDTWWYHAFNVIIHCATTILVFFIVRRLLVWANIGESTNKGESTNTGESTNKSESRRGLLAGFAAALFLLHPAQTEAVSYVGGRSDALSAMLAYAAFAVFLYRREDAATWKTAAAVFLLFGAALAAKEDTIALPALLLLTDLWWSPGRWSAGSRWHSVQRNWKIYLPMALGSVAGLAFFWQLITHATTAGFGFKEFTWYQYFFTQWRAVFVYLGIFLWPANLTLDWDFPISHTVLEHGAIIWLAMLIALLVAAWMLRRRFPLAAYGFLVFLILLAPTSSILPIKDPVAERRLYFAMLGLLLIVVDLASRIEVDRRTLAAGGLAVLLIAAFTTHARASVWSDEVSIWEDTARKSPGAWRPHFQLGFAYYKAQRYDLALREFEETAKIHPSDPDLLLDWGLTYDSLNQLQPALDKLLQSARLKPTAQAFSQIGMVYGKLENWPDALANLALAQKLDPNFPDTYVYLGVVHTRNNQLVEAIQDFRRALQLDPANTRAQQFLKAVANQLSAGAPNK
jgi:protein O-mannosyl-transferase